jgi:hypothetical protein
MNVAEKLLHTRVKYLPKKFHTIIQVSESYEVMISTGGSHVSVTVSRKKSPGKGAHVVINDPDPELKIMDIYQKARELIESLIWWR